MAIESRKFQIPDESPRQLHVVPKLDRETKDPEQPLVFLLPNGKTASLFPSNLTGNQRFISSYFTDTLDEDGSCRPVSRDFLLEQFLKEHPQVSPTQAAEKIRNDVFFIKRKLLPQGVTIENIAPARQPAQYALKCVPIPLTLVSSQPNPNRPIFEIVREVILRANNPTFLSNRERTQKELLEPV